MMLISEVLPAPDAPNSPGDAALAFERGFQREFAELFGDVDAQHGQFPSRRLVARRANHSEAIARPWR